MGSFSNYLENKWLNHILKGAAFTKPTAIYMALSTADLTEDGSGLAEPAGDNYARKSCLANFSAASTTRVISNNSDIVFNQASGSWGTISYWGLYDNSTGGNLLAYGAFSVGKLVTDGQTPKVLSGELDISIPDTNGMGDYVANGMLNHTFQSGGVSYTQSTNLYLVLGGSDFGTALSEWAPETEIAGSGYARKNHNTFTITDSAATNNGAITFDVATGTWGEVSHWAIGDSATLGEGNVLVYGEWTTPSTILADDQVNIASGNLDITMG